MRLREHVTTAVLVGAVLAAATYVYVTSDKVTTKEQEGRKSNVVKVYRPDDLTEITFERDGKRFRLHRASTAADAGEARLWHVDDAGRDSLADQFVVDRALTSIEFAFPLREIKKEDVDRKAYGLDTPRFRMTLRMGKLSTTVAVGGPAAKPEGAVYVDVDGAVLVTKKESFASIDIPPDAFRTRTVVPYISTDCASLVLAKGESKLALSRGPGSTWKLDGEGGGRVDRLALDRVLSAFADTKADHFLDEATARGVQKGAPTVRLTMTPTDKAKPAGALVVGGVCPGHDADVVVVREAPTPLFVCSARGVFDALSVDAASLVDTHPFSFREDEVEEVLMVEGDRKLELARKDKGWHQRQPVEADLPVDQVKLLLKGMLTVRSETPAQVATLEAPRAKITLRATPDPTLGDRPAEVLTVHEPEKDGRVPIRREQDGVVLRVSREDARAFSVRTTSLRSLRVVDAPVDKIKKISLNRPEGPHVIERTDGGTWSMLEPKGMPVDLGVAAAIADQTAKLIADSWVADRDDGTFGLAKPRLSYELVLREGEGTKTIKVELGDPGRGGVYGRLVGQEGVFVVPRAVETTLSAWAVELAATTLEPSDVTELVFRRKGAPDLRLVPTKEGFRVESGELPTSRLPGIRDALHDLRADAVVHLGQGRKGEGFDAPTLEIKGKRASGKELSIVIGAGDAFRGVSVFYARRDGVDVVFAIPASRVRTLLALLG